jgi:HK97 family phage major capsid protein/HK97 family phage prohead protease
MSNKPTDGMVTAAKRALEWRKEYGRGGTAVGVARARDIANRSNLSDDTVKRMYSFFSRHENNKAKHYSAKEPDGGPTAWRIAWDLWGGNAGYSFSKRIAERLEKERSMQDMDKSDTISPDIEDETMTDEVRAEPDGLSVGDFVSWDSSGGEAYGKVERIERDGSIDVPDSDFTINGDADDPAALIEVYREGEDGYEASGRMVGHRFSTLTKAAERGYKDKDEMRFDPSKMETRGMTFKTGAIDEEKRTVNISVSSETPVERSFGKEILDHSERSVDLEFASSGNMPLLLDHDPRQQIGVVEDVSLDSSARRLRATVRFGRNGLAKEIFDDVVDGIRNNISVGYHVNDMQKESADSYRVNSWQVMEVSVVSIPADTGVGTNRGHEVTPSPKPETLIREENTMSEENTIDIEAVKAEATRAAAKDTAEMYRLASKHNKREMADKAVAEGRSLAEFRGELLEAIGNTPLDTQEIGLTKKEVRNFSLMKAIRAMANPTDRNAQAEAAFEFEAAQEAAKRAGADPQGLYMPHDVLRSWSQRDLNTSDDSAMVAEAYRGGDFIDVLRNASSVMQAGATMLTGLSGDVKIPKKTAASTGAWIATEGGASTESEPTFGQVTMSPKTVGAFTDITRLMMMQSSLDIENLVRSDLSAGIALAIDSGALSGSGSSGQPTGISNTSGINAPTSFAAANPTFAEVVAMETAVAEDNALLGNLAYILPASMAGALKTTAKDAGSGQFVLAGGEMNGYRAIVSNQVTAGDLYFGNFADCLIGMYGGLDITVDPYTASTSGTVRIVALQTMDVAVRHAVSFAYNNDGA